MEEPFEESDAEPAFVMRKSEVDTTDGKVTIATLVCEPLDQAGFINAFSTRLGGVSPLPSNALSLAYFKGDEAGNVAENRRRFVNAIGAEQAQIITARQTHSSERFAVESQAQVRGAQPECDAMITRMTDVLLAIQTADCLPVLIGDTKTGTMAAIHAGWRGTAARITERTVADLMMVHGVNPRDCLAALGPAACAACYEVGGDVIDRFKREFGYWRNLLVNFTEDGKAYLDIRAANVQQLIFCGFDADCIHVADYCTMHQNDLFFSYRREGKGLPSGVGRSLSVIGKAGS
jgi:YfiH family protein